MARGEVGREREAHELERRHAGLERSAREALVGRGADTTGSWLDTELDTLARDVTGVTAGAAALSDAPRVQARLRVRRAALTALASAVAVAAGLVLAGEAYFGRDAEEAVPEVLREAVPGRVPPKLLDTTVVKGGRPRERAVLGRVVGGMEKTTLTRIAITPLEARPDSGGGAAVALSFTPVPGPSVRRQWDEWIVAGGFSRRLQEAGLPAAVEGRDPDGRFLAKPKVKGKPDPQPLSREQEAAVVKAIRSAATRSGGDVVRLEVHRPYGVAVALSLAADDPASFLKERLRPLVERLEVHRARLEGIYLAVLDERRRIAMEWGSWTRNPAGSYWVRRDLANCSPIRQSEPSGTKPAPACPA